MRPEDTQMASGRAPGPTIESMVTITGDEYERLRGALRRIAEAQPRVRRSGGVEVHDVQNMQITARRALEGR